MPRSLLSSLLSVLLGVYLEEKLLHSNFLRESTVFSIVTGHFRLSTLPEVVSSFPCMDVGLHKRPEFVLGHGMGISGGMELAAS